MTAPLDTAGLVAELKARLDKRRVDLGREVAQGWTDKFENAAAWATLTVPFNELVAIFDALTAKHSELAEARAVLEPFAKIADTDAKLIRYSATGWNEEDMTPHCARARTVLTREASSNE